MDTKTISKQAKKAVAIGLCASLVGGVAAPVLSTTHVAYAAVAGKPQPNTTHSSIIQFKDQVLKERILSKMKKQNLIDQSAVDITEDDALKVTEVWFPGNRIKSIKGLEFFKNLTTLHLSDNQISDISALAGLSKLTVINLSYNHLSDLTPLAALTNLTELYLNRNQISDISALAGLPNLTSLDLSNNKISDMTFLRELGDPFEDKTKLNAKDQTITLRPGTSKVNLAKEIKGFGHVAFKSDENIVDDVLTYKDGMQNPYTVNATDGFKYSATVNVDFSQAKKETVIQFKDKNLKNAILADMKKQHLIDQSAVDITEDDALKVGRLDLFGKLITSIEGLEKFKNLTELWLTDNNISNIEPLSSLPNLTNLSLYRNHISDLTPLSGLSKLETLNAKDQTITLHPNSSTVDLAKEIKGAGKVVFITNGIAEDGVITHQSWMQNPYVMRAKDGENYSATVNIYFSNVPKSSETQAEDISNGLETLLNEYDAVKGTDNYKNADDKLKQVYDKAIKDGQKIYDKLSSTPAQVKQVAETIKTALEALNGDKKAQATIQSLQQQLNTATGNIQKLTSELEKAKQQGKADASTIANLTGQVSTLTQQLEKLKSDKTLSDTQKQAEIDKLNGKIAELGKQIKQLTTEKQTLQQQLDTATGNIQKLTGELEKAKQQGKADASTIANLTGQVSTLTQQLEKLKSDKTLSDTQKQAEIDKLNGKIAELGKQIKQLTQENTTLKGQVASLQEQLGKLQGRLQSAQQQGVADKATIERLTGQVASLSSQLDALKADKTKSEQEKQKEIERLSGQVRDLTSQVSTLTSEKRSLQQQLDAATGKVSALTSELEQLKAAKKQADEKNQQTIAGLNSQITQLTQDKQGLQDQINTKQSEISKLQGQIQALKDDHSKSDEEKQQEIARLTAQLATLTQEKQDLQGKLDAANEKVSTLTQQLQQAASKADADKKQLQELTNALQQTKQQLDQLKQDKTKSDTEKQKEIDKLNAKIAELEKKVQMCTAQSFGGSIVAPLVNDKPTFDIEKYKREHNYALPGIAAHTYQANPDTFTSDVHAALQQLAPMAASTNAAAQATAQRTDESERAQAEQKANTSSKQDADKTKLDQNKFPQTGDNSLLALLSTFAGALVLVLGCFARKKSSKANKR
ncbi:leucine-rich repeat domain-containing protein [Eggerthellaceae bacterium PR-HUZ602407-17]